VYGSGYLTKVIFPPASKVALVEDSESAGVNSSSESNGSNVAGSDAGRTNSDPPGIPIEDASVKTVSFRADVLPILMDRCVECHGPDKVKGGLRMDTEAELFAGDSEWWSVIPGQPDDSLLLQRVELPADDPDVMPPKGEMLTTEQIELIREWIASGAGHADPGQAAEAAGPDEGPTTVDQGAPPSAAAIQVAVGSLRERQIVVGPISQSDTDFDVNASLVKPPFADEDLSRLDGLQPVLVWANFARSALTDAGIGSLGEFDRITRLRIDNTELGDGAVETLLALPALEWLNMFGTKLTDAGLARLVSHPGLTRLYCGESAVTAAGVQAARESRPDLMIVGPELETIIN